MTRDGWRETALGGLVAGRRGLQTGPFGNELRAADYAEDPTDRDVPVVMPKDLVDGAVSTAAIARVPAAKAAGLARYRVLAGDVLVARRGDVGRCVLVTTAEEGWLCGTGCLRARLDGAVEPRYLVQYLRWPATVAWLVRNAVGQTMLNLNTRILSRLPVRLPPLAEQRRIAAALESADEMIRSTRAALEQARRVHFGLMRDLLRRKAGPRAAGPRAAGPRAAGPRETRSLGELCAFANGHRFPAEEWSDDGLPIIRIQNLNGSREFNHFAGYAKPEWVVEPGELLFAWAGKKGSSFGPCLWSGPRGVLNQHIFRIRPTDRVSKVWLYETLRQLTRRIESQAHGFKASLVHVRKADITGQRVPVPPYEEQCAIAQRSAELTARESLEEAALERAIAIRRGLMQDLFTSRVRSLRAPRGIG